MSENQIKFHSERAHVAVNRFVKASKGRTPNSLQGGQ